MRGVHEEILSRFRTLLNLDCDKINEAGTRISIPIFESNLLIKLVDDAIYLLKKQPVLVEINSPAIIVGDLHGSLHDLLRILKSGEPPKIHFLFLGDYIDRGPLSLEVITLLVALFCFYPNHITLLRGNHELKSTISKYGFKDEVESVYKDLAVFEEFHKLFAYLPLAAVVNKNIFCVHGGISPVLYNINQISNIQKPILDEKLDLISHLLWADPSKSFNDFSVSERGNGITFGEGAASNFFSYSGMKIIIRGHQCVNGFDYTLNGRCITVFSSSDYDSKSSNSSGYVFISKNSDIEPKTFPPIKKLERKNYNFFKYIGIPMRKPLNLQSNALSFYTSPVARPKSKVIKSQLRSSLILKPVIPSVI